MKLCPNLHTHLVFKFDSIKKKKLNLKLFLEIVILVCMRYFVSVLVAVISLIGMCCKTVKLAPMGPVQGNSGCK